ncbi:MAG TPA: efflux RND transporter permease subunit [Blastocatellia bacterium]|nr:efflux RND transporter permease subunit [Blastocatellia bacterium]
MIQPSKLVVLHPKPIIAITIAVTVASLAIILFFGISFNGSPETLARRDEAFDFYNETRKVFGDDHVIIVGITTSNVFSSDFLVKLGRLTDRLATIDGVDQSLSLTNIKAVTKVEGGISIGRLIDPGSLSQLDSNSLARLRDEVTKDPLYAKNYVSTDGTTAAIDVFLKTLDEARAREVAEQIEQLAKSEAKGDEVFLAGVPIVDSRGIKSMLRDMLVLSPIAAVLCFGVFLFAFRSFWGAVLPMSALIIDLIWTIGLMSLLGKPFTLATLPLPTTLMAVGSSYIFHVLNQYRVSMSSLTLSHDARSEQTAWLDGLTFICPAVIVSATATMAGFGALASSTVPTARDMGIFETLGVLALLFLTIGFIPAALALLPRHALGEAGPGKTDYVTWLNPLLVNITALILFKRRQVLVATLLATVAVGAGAMWLKVNTNYLRIFPSHSETVRDAEKLHQRLAGGATVQIVVSGAPGAITDPQFLRSALKLERFALTQPGVDAGISAVDIINRIDSLMPRPVRNVGNESAGDLPSNVQDVPADPRRLSAIFRDYLSEDSSLSRLVSSDGSRMVIILRVNLFSSNELRELTQNIDRWSAANLPSGVSQRATGSIILLNDASDAVAESQSSSLAIALVTIYLMMVVLFRSFATGLLALIPNLIPIVGYFGFLGWTGIPLDITTSLVASAVLGLAVDNAVHMIRRYRQCVAERKSVAGPVEASEDISSTNAGWAMWLSMLRTGKPMVLANFMLIAAFLVFVLSSFVPVRIAGILWALGIGSCLAADLVLLPVLMKSKIFVRAALGKDLNTSGRETLKTRVQSMRSGRSHDSL